MHQFGQLVGQHLLGQLAPLPLCIFRLQRLNLGQRHKAVVAQEAVDILVRRAEPELVEGVRGGERRIEPNRTTLGLAEFGAVRLGDERQCHAIDLCLIEAAGEIHAAGDVAPLVVAANLQGAAEALVEHREVLGLQQGVGELGERDTLIRAGQPLAHRFAGQHGVDREVLADVAQKIEGGHLLHPVGVVDQQRRCQPFAGWQQRFYLGRQTGYPALHRLGAVEVALGRLEAGIADKAGGTAHQCHRGVARQLEAAQHQQWNQMADVQAASGGIEPAVDGARGGKMVGQRRRFGILGHQAASGQLIEQMGVDHGFSNSRGKRPHPRRSGSRRICPSGDSFATLVLASGHRVTIAQP